MLIPQFSLRWLLAVITVFSVAFLMVSYAVQGSLWAIGVSIGLLSLVVLLLLHGFTFFLVWLFATFTAKRKPGRGAKSLVFLLTLSAGASIATAGGASHMLPANGKPAPNGISLILDATWPETIGYRPVTFKATCSPPLNADRTLSFEFRFQDWGNNAPLTTTVDLEIPAGAATASTTIAVPDFCVWQSYSIDTWEDGRHVPELSQRGIGTGVGWNGFGIRPAVLFVRTNLIDVSTLNSVFPDSRYQTFATTTPPTGPIFPGDWAQFAPAALPEDWLCYQGLDALFISLPDLQSLAQSSPKTFAAIRDWLRTGGNLIVYGSEGDSRRLDEIDNFLKLPGGVTGESAHWKKPAASDYDSTLANVDQPISTVVDVDEDGNPIPPEKRTPPNNPPFRWRAAQQGAVVAIDAADPFGTTLDQQTWCWIFNTLGKHRWLSSYRTGVNHFEDNPDFWTFLIPGVGSAPVDAYRVLITAFVLFIGPVNYLLLRKHKRLHLLLLTVPACALIVTGTLLVWALFSDGLYTRSRSRSITLVDQRTNDHVTWSRSSLYSGLAPSNGLRFSRSTAVIPFAYEPQFIRRQTQRVVQLAPDHQQLSRGWLPSRTLVQNINIRPFSSPVGLKFTAGAGGKRVQNNLGTRIHALLVHGENDQYGYAEDIEAGQSASLAPLSKNRFKQMQKMLDANNRQTLSLPPGFANESPSDLFGFGRSWSYGSGQFVGASQATSHLEVILGRAKAAVQEVAAHGSSSSLGPNSYIAVVDRPEFVELGLEDVTEIDGFHVIFGTW